MQYKINKEKEKHKIFLYWFSDRVDYNQFSINNLVSLNKLTLQSTMCVLFWIITFLSNSLSIL